MGGTRVYKGVRHRTASRRAATLFAAALVAAAAGLESEARTGALNLPSLQTQVVIEGPSHRVLRHALTSRRDDRSWAADDQVAKILADALPRALRAGCNEMITTWGENLAGTARLAARPLYVGTQAEGGFRQALLAFRCFSAGVRDYYDHDYYDERLALLAVGSDATYLSLIPHAPACAGCEDWSDSALVHIALGEALRLGGKRGVSLVVSISSDNPCCGGADSLEAERVVWYLLDGKTAKPVASALRRQKRGSGDAEEGDTLTVYHGTITSEKDQTGGVVQITSRYSITENDEPKGEGVLRYRWNAKNEEFEKVGR